MQNKTRCNGKAKWKLQWLIFVLLVFPTISPCQSASDFLELTVPEITERISPSIVTIFVYNATGTVIGQGSGFFVTETGAILTNAHVVKNAYSALVIAESDTFRLITVWMRDETKDLALISVPLADSVTAAVLADSMDFRPGTRVVAIGNPLGLEKTVSDGLISAIRKINGVELIQTSAPISPGSSGGPLLDMFGQVIGVTTSTFQEGQNLNFAVSVNTINEFLHLNVKEEKLKWAGEKVWYKVIFKWIGNIVIWIIGIFFGGWYFVIPIVLFAFYALYWVFYGLYRLITYPFRRAKEKREAERYHQLLATSRSSSPEVIEPSDNLEEENITLEEEVDPDYPIIHYCWKCGSKLTLPESARGQSVGCQSCHTLLNIPND